MNKSRSEGLNTSVDDLRQTVNDVMRSRDMLKIAERNLQESREQFYLKKAEVLEGLHRTEETRRGLVGRMDETKRSMSSVRSKKSQITRDLTKRHSELKALLDRQFSRSLRILNDKTEEELSELMSYSTYLKKKTSSFDLLKAKITKRVQHHDDFDLDFVRIQDNVAQLERFPSRLRSPPVSTLFVTSRKLPLNHTQVFFGKNDDDDVSEMTESEVSEQLDDQDVDDEMSLKRIANDDVEEEEENDGELDMEFEGEEGEEEEEEGIPKGDEDLEVTDIIGDDDDDDDDTVSLQLSDVATASTTSSIISTTSTDLLEDTPSGRRKLSGSFRWTYQIIVEYVDIQLSEKRKKRGTAFLVWDSRLSRSFFVTTAKLFREGLENVITNIHLSNKYSQDLYLGTASIRMGQGKNVQVAFLKIPPKYSTATGFSLVDTEVGFVGMSCFTLGVSSRKGKTQVMKNTKIVEMERKKLGLELMMERELCGAPVLSTTGRLVGMAIEKDLVKSYTSGVSINFIFNQYLKCFK